ncbi:MAG: class I SAM-dependent methyltransferase [Rhizobiales bacterium]|nr:class I SAM-dependent methyltransferase [Hyphomicrobiales bacterium]
MISDGAIVPRPLGKASCNDCGHGFHVEPIQDNQLRELYGDAYSLGLRDKSADADRASGYCEHISEHLGSLDRHIERGHVVVEFGCGTGHLLRKISQKWQPRRLVGIEPAPKLANKARELNGKYVEIIESYAESSVPLVKDADFAISVNVIEHALDPVAFLKTCRDSINERGTILVICPDGNYPHSELLFYDHVSSFSVTSFERAASQAGLKMLHSATLGNGQEGFQLFVLAPDGSAQEPSAGSAASFQELSEGRGRYLKGWATLEQGVRNQIGSDRYAIFGIGEYADLLSAYCPGIIGAAECFVVDNAPQPEYRGKPLLSLDAFRQEKPDTRILAAVNPRSWKYLIERLRSGSVVANHPYEFSELRSAL